MGIRASVFASNSERTNYHRLSRVWGRRYRVWHNLPFLNVYTTERLLDPLTVKPFQLDERDIQRLKKTSIDYVLCTLEDEPLICIDFDGLGQGFRARDSYVHGDFDDPGGWRDRIMSLKVKISQASGVCNPKSVPYLIVGSDEFRDLSPTIKLTTVDGIVGALLTSRACHEHFSKGFEPEFVGMTQEQFDDLSDGEKSNQIGDWIMANETAFEAEHSPVIKANGRLLSMMRERGIYETGCSASFEYDPPLPENLTPRERVVCIDNAQRIGVTYIFRYLLVKPGQRLTIRHPGRPKGELFVSRTVWLPNLYTLGVPILDLGSEIGRMLCQMELKGRYPVVMPESPAPHQDEALARATVKHAVLRKLIGNLGKIESKTDLFNPEAS